MKKLIEEILKSENSVSIIEKLIVELELSEEYEDSKFVTDLYNSSLIEYNKILSSNGFSNLDMKDYNYGSVKYFIKNTSTRFKVRDFFKEKDFYTEIVVEDNKTFIKVNKSRLTLKELIKLREEIESLKFWCENYVEELNNQCEVNDNELKEVKDGEFSMIEIESLKRILIKVSYNDRFTFRGLFKTAKWEPEFKAWRISNIASNKEKIEELKNKLTLI